MSYNDDVLFTGKEPDADLGPLISPAAKERVLSLVESGVNEGAELLLDGRGVNVPGYEKGNFVGPTVLNKVTVSEKDFITLYMNFPFLQWNMLCMFIHAPVEFWPYFLFVHPLTVFPYSK